jgi:hypothetical protein
LKHLLFASLLLGLWLLIPLYGKSAHLNTVRHAVGLNTLTSNQTLSRASLSHAKYLIRHQQRGHYQRYGTRGYLGRTPAMRVTRKGYASSDVAENISINTHSDHQSVENLLGAIYHRFTFLNFISDEIGIAHARNMQQKSIQQIYLYTLGNSTIRKLCTTPSAPLLDGDYYVKNLCKNGKKVSFKHYQATQKKIRSKNAKIVYYPYPHQKEINPAFYNEDPDPLPRYRVSGFPISVEFNPAYYRKIKLQKFRLYNHQGEEITQRKILHAKSDPHRRFTPLQFALMPLRRLEFNQRYHVVFEALADGKKIKKKWSFQTQKRANLYTITQKETTLYLSQGEKILYIPPQTRDDIITSYRASTPLKTSLIDPNTLRIMIPSSIPKRGFRITLSNKKQIFIKPKE